MNRSITNYYKKMEKDRSNNNDISHNNNCQNNCHKSNSDHKSYKLQNTSRNSQRQQPYNIQNRWKFSASVSNIESTDRTCDTISPFATSSKLLPSKTPSSLEYMRQPQKSPPSSTLTASETAVLTTKSASVFNVETAGASSTSPSSSSVDSVLLRGWSSMPTTSTDTSHLLTKINSRNATRKRKRQDSINEVQVVCCASSRSLERPVKSTYMLQNPVATQQISPNVFTFQFAPLNSNPSRPTSLGVNPTESSQIVPALMPIPVNILVPESSKGSAPLPTNPTYPTYSPILSSSEPNINASMVVALTRYTTTMRRGACGLSAAYTNKVVGGMEARRGAYPWMVALGYRDEYNPDALKFLCAGSLISSRSVLTSGHCISALLITARLGAHDISNLNEVGAINIPIERKIVHEQYDLRHVVNDIGLAQLAVPAPETAYIGTICLPEGPRFAENLAGMNPFVAGWGAVKFQGPSSNVLRDAQVPIVSQQTCEQSYKSIFQHMVFVDRFICAGNSYVDACQGDSGGPLMMPMLEDGVYRYYILGIVSYGYECARVGFPGVYTRLASYMPWILSHMV